jgi:hypothetical protein
MAWMVQAAKRAKGSAALGAKLALYSLSQPLYENPLGVDQTWKCGGTLPIAMR